MLAFNFSSADIEAAAKVAGLFGAAIAWLYQVRTKLQREKIKADLDILKETKKLFGETDDRVKRIEAAATQAMKYLYRDGREKGKWHGIAADIAVLVLCAAGALVFAWSGTHPLNYLELGVAAVLIFVSFGAFLNALDKKSVVLPNA